MDVKTLSSLIEELANLKDRKKELADIVKANNAAIEEQEKIVISAINDIIETLLTLDYECKIVTHEYEHYRNECIEYTNLLGGYVSDGLTDRQKAELAELVKKWDEEEETPNA